MIFTRSVDLPSFFVAARYRLIQRLTPFYTNTEQQTNNDHTATMFFCCGRKAKAVDAPAADQVTEKRLSSTSLNATATSSPEQRQQQQQQPATQPPAPTEFMDYARARREAEERELERVRSEISGLSTVREEQQARESMKQQPLRVSLTSVGSEGFLGLPLSPGAPQSPRLQDARQGEGEDDWARHVMESVSRAGSTYEGDKSRPVTPSIMLDGAEIDEEEHIRAASPVPRAQTPVKEPKADTQEPEPEMEKEKAESLYITPDAAAAFINYHHEPVPVPPIPTVEPEEDEEEEPQQPEEPAEPKRESMPAHKHEEDHTSLYITPDHAAAFINFDAALAPPTPAASFSGDEAEKTAIRTSLTHPARCPSPAPSIAISEYETDALNTKRLSTLSTISTIAASAAAAAIERHSIAGKRMSGLSTYSTASYYSTRPSSPAPPINNRLSQLRGTMTSPAPPSRLSIFSTEESVKESNEAHLLPYLSPLTSQLLPKLDKMLSTTSILSAYSRWETAMSLRREVRAFIASGVDDYLDEDGQVEEEAGLKKAVDGFLVRGRRVQDAEDAATADDVVENNGRGESKMFGDVRAFWAGEKI